MSIKVTTPNNNLRNLIESIVQACSIASLDNPVYLVCKVINNKVDYRCTDERNLLLFLYHDYEIVAVFQLSQ